MNPHLSRLAITLTCLHLGCGGKAEETPAAAFGKDAGSDGCSLPCPSPPPGCQYQGSGSCDPPSCPALVCADAPHDATCQIACANPPPGCHFVGEPTCEPPTCPPVQCEDASVDAGCEIDCGAPPPGCYFVGEPTCEPPACPPMECVDASADAGGFASNLDGIWLFGWSGGMNHFSWVRITASDLWGGPAQYLSGADLAYNVPLWDCSGAGTWMLTAKPDTIGLNFPDTCATGFQSYTFVSFQSPSDFPKGAILEATLEGLGSPGQTIHAFKFPDSQCTAAMDACIDPLQ